ncbi:MAG: helix-turn-helix domain-containing protein [Nitrososphaerales archaeon]
MRDDLVDKMAQIAGEVVMDDKPGLALKNWRERLKIKQIDMAKEMKISSSVLSDYESGRRRSPGSQFIKKYVEVLVKLASQHNRFLDKNLEKKYSEAILGMKDFSEPIKVSFMIEKTNAEILTGEEFLNYNLYGYTVVDSIKAIYLLSGFDFFKIFGTTTERALIFTKVGMGRSPLVAIRVSPLKPRMVIIHGPKKVDPLAIDLAKKEKIVLALSNMKDEEALISSLTLEKAFS